MTFTDRVKLLRGKPRARAPEEKLSAAQAEAVMERLAAQQRCTMFLAGLSLGAALTALTMLHAYGMLALLIAFEVVWIACRGWPWEL